MAEKRMRSVRFSHYNLYWKIGTCGASVYSDSNETPLLGGLVAAGVEARAIRPTGYGRGDIRSIENPSNVEYVAKIFGRSCLKLGRCSTMEGAMKLVEDALAKMFGTEPVDAEV